MGLPAVELDDVSVERSGRRVLAGVSLAVATGAVTALIGPSGAGKSTVLRCCVRFEEPVAGRVLVGGADVRELDPCALRRRLALVAQSPVMLPGDVEANLRYGLAETAPAEVVPEALEAAGLAADFLRRPAAELSGGEAARVAIARALTRGPEVLLLDEPTAALDGRASAGIEVLIRRLAGRGLTVLLVTHDERQARRVASEAVRLAAGGVAAAGPAAAVLAP